MGPLRLYLVATELHLEAVQEGCSLFSVVIVLDVLELIENQVLLLCLLAGGVLQRGARRALLVDEARLAQCLWVVVLRLLQLALLVAPPSSLVMDFAPTLATESLFTFLT